MCFELTAADAGEVFGVVFEGGHDRFFAAQARLLDGGLMACSIRL